MDDLFNSSISSSNLNYIALRNAPRLLELRNYCEELWKSFSPYADPTFRDEFARQFHPRFWEMYLCNQLLNMGFNLIPTDKRIGPDFLLKIDSLRVWIEATASDEGEGADAVPDIFDHFRFDPIPEEKIILRFTNSIASKSEKYYKYVRDGIINELDAFILAINGKNIGVVSCDPSPIPAIVKAVYPLGEHTVTIDTETLEIIDERYHYRGEVVKQSGSSVSTSAFLDPARSGISGILYSEEALWDLSPAPERELIFIHNYLAKTPLKKGWLNSGREYWREGNSLVWVDN